MDYEIIGWDVQTEDAALVPHEADFGKKFYDMIIRQQLSSANVLMHEMKENTTNVVLPYGVTVLKKAGYTLSSVAQCVGKPDRGEWYQAIGKAEERDERWTCEKDL